MPLDGNANMVKIGGDLFWVRTIAPHPTNPDVIYLTNTNGTKANGLYKATKSGSTWNFQLIEAGTGHNSEVAVWIDNGKTYVYYWANFNGEFKGKLSINGGAFSTVIDASVAQSKRTPYWKSVVGSDFKFQSNGGVIGDGNTIIANYYDHTMQLSYGVFKGTIQSNGTVSWEDWTGSNLHFGGSTAMKLTGSGTSKKLYMSTSGAGLLSRDFTTSGSVAVTGVTVNNCSSPTISIGATVDLNETVSPSNATNKSVTWSSSNNNVATVSSSGLVTAVAAGSATITVTTVSGSKTATCGVTVNGSVTAKAIPGKIEVEDYNTGGQGVGYNDLTSGNSGGSYRTDDVDIQSCSEGGYNVGWTDAGEWLDYTVNVASAGTYDLKLRVARSNSGSSPIKVLFGGVDKTGNLDVPNTGGWQTYTTVTKSVSLSAGQQVMRISMVGGSYNINYIELTGATPPPSTTYRYLRLTVLGTTGLDMSVQQIHWMDGSTSYPNPKLVNGDQSKVTSSTNGGNDYRAFDNTNSGWNVGSTYSQWITIDLGAGNEIAPDEIQIKGNAGNRAPSSFQCHGSNNNSSWTLLHSRTGLTSTDYPSNLGTFSFGSGSREVGLVSVVVSDLKMYPNPLRAGAKLFVDSSNLSDFNMQVMSLDGKVLFEKQVASQETRLELQVEALSQAGIYLIRCTSGDKSWMQKLIVK